MKWKSGIKLVDRGMCAHVNRQDRIKCGNIKKRAVFFLFYESSHVTRDKQ